MLEKQKHVRLATVGCKQNACKQKHVRLTILGWLVVLTFKVVGLPKNKKAICNVIYVM